MYQKLTDRVGVLVGGVNVGVIHTADNRVLLVDTGANEGNARKLLRCVRNERGAEISGILTTHGHADHFGGHAFIVKRTNATVHAPSFDASVLRHPELQPIFMFGGAAPPAALRERFILAHASPVDHEIGAGRQTIDGVDVDVISLPGHSPNQVGYLVDGVFFCADVVFPGTAIEKYRIPYLYDLSRHIDAMDTARSVSASCVVPGHGPVEPDLDQLHAMNRAIIDETIACIRGSLTRPMSLEQIAQSVFERMHVPMAGHVSFYLLRPTIGAYLTHLEQAGEVDHVMDDKVARWQRA